jgi:hypothetical protein
MLEGETWPLTHILVSYFTAERRDSKQLFLSCLFAKNCWASINVQIPSWLRAIRATTYMKRHIGLPFVIEIIITMCWCIWKERNAWLFSDPSVEHCKNAFMSEFALLMHRATPIRAQHMSQWLVSIA